MMTKTHLPFNEEMETELGKDCFGLQFCKAAAMLHYLGINTPFSTNFKMCNGKPGVVSACL
jgi:hypothetical protein